MKRKMVPLLAAAVMIQGACGASGVVGGDTSFPDVDRKALEDGNAGFALALFGRLCDEDDAGNVMLSPYSVSSALAMTWAGARGDTEARMAGVLGFGSGQSQVHQGFRMIDAMLSGPARESAATGTPVTLATANALWVESGFPLLETYVDLVGECYGAEARNVDFSGDPEAQRTVINDWVSDRTEDRIRDLLGPGTVSAATRVVLTNAVYFKGDWLAAFDPQATRDAPFTTLAGEQVSVPTMHRTTDLPYVEGDGFRAVSLPYSDGLCRMILVLPEGDLRTFEQGLDMTVLSTLLDGMATEEIALAMPRFEYTSSYSLEPDLSALGMGCAFDPAEADFSGFTGGRDLFLSAVVHKAFIRVDETGTEAAAATGAVMMLTAMPGHGPVPFVLDRPFIFLVTDDPTGSILFMGRVADPSV